ncbi:MAG: NnrS family protein [Myxococcota bacterium]
MAPDLPLAHDSPGLLARPNTGGTVLLAGGFRPFFLLAGLYAVASIVAWLIAYAGAWTMPAGWVPMWWHGHELIFGFAAAAIGGFLLTAVPKWTGTAPVRGAPLGALVLTWAGGRAAMWAAGPLPDGLVALVDLAFFPALMLAVGRPILRSGNRRNYGFPVLLLALFAANGLTHAQTLGLANTGRTGLYMALYIVVIMVTVVAGRIVPAFTAGALARQGAGAEVRPSRGLGRAAVVAVVLAGALQVVGVRPELRGGAAALAAVLLALRSLGWKPFAVLQDPMVWVLHVGHLWLVIGFAGLAAADLGTGLATSTATHALTAGAIGTMVLAVMTRASLGHTGRPLEANVPVTIAYVLVITGAVVRVFGPLSSMASHGDWVLAGGVAWATGYALFAVVYAPILLRPRIDGRPG